LPQFGAPLLWERIRLARADVNYPTTQYDETSALQVDRPGVTWPTGEAYLIYPPLPARITYCTSVTRNLNRF